MRHLRRLRQIVGPRADRYRLRSCPLRVEHLEERLVCNVGNLDPLFGVQGQLVLPSQLGANAQVNAVVVLRDGIDTTADPILLAGRSGDQAFLTRLRPDGTPDPTFADNGTLFFAFANPAEATSLVVADGKYLVGLTTESALGRDVALTRINDDGTIDTTFGFGGRVVLDINISGAEGGGPPLPAFPFSDDMLTGLVAAPGGAFLATGTAEDENGRDIFVARFNSSGFRDFSFGSAGIARIDLGGDAIANALAVKADGRIVVAGAALRPYANGVNNDFLVAQLTPDGLRDANFGVNGIVSLDFAAGLPANPGGTPVAHPAYDDMATDLLIQGNRIVVAGRANNGRFDYFALARFNANGTLDATFGAVKGALPAAPSFGPAGTITTPIGPASDEIFDLVQQPNGKLVVVGQSLRDELGTGADMALARYFADGQPDLTFGEDGRFLTPFPAGTSRAFGVDFGDNGTLVLAGALTANGLTLAAVERLQADIRPVAQPNNVVAVVDPVAPDTVIVGPLDNDFDPDPFDQLSIVALRVAGLPPLLLPANGGSLITPQGTLTSDGNLIRFFPAAGFSGRFDLTATVSDGWLSVDEPITIQVDAGGVQQSEARDLTLGGNVNRVSTPFGLHNLDAAASVTLSGNRTLVVGTLIDTNTLQASFALMAYNADGSLDPTFGDFGRVITTFGPGLNATARAVVVQSDGRIVVVGNVAATNGPSDFALARYLPDGRLDTSYDGDGLVQLDLGGDDVALAAVLDPTGDVIVGGVSDAAGVTVVQDFALARVRRGDGGLDTTFGASNGFTFTDFNGPDLLRGLAIQGDKLIAVGTANLVGEGRDVALARYSLAGVLDTTFASDGIRIDDFSGLRDDAVAVAIDASNRIVIVGVTSSVATGRDVLVARYTSEGTRDTAFGVNGFRTFDGANSLDQGTAVAVRGSDIFVGGFLTVPNNFSIFRTLAVESRDFFVARLDDAGTVQTQATTDFVGRDDRLTGLNFVGDRLIASGIVLGRTAGRMFGLVGYDATSLAIDTNFGGAIPGFGTVTSAVNGDSIAEAVGVQTNGRIVLAGSAANGVGRDFALFAYLPNGRPDPSFGVNGAVTLDFFGKDDVIHALLVLPDDSLLVVGSATQANDEREFAVAKFLPDGSLDVAFGVNGRLATGFGDEAFDVVRLPNGHFVLAGFTTVAGRKQLALQEIDETGVEAGFGRRTVALSVDAEIRAIVRDGATGDLIVAGVAGLNDNRDVLLARFNADGSLDTSFNPNGVDPGVLIVNASGSARADAANAVALDAQGNIVLAGFVTNANATTDFLAGRFSPTGVADAAFGAAGTGFVVVTNLSAGNDVANDILLRNGQIILAGLSTGNNQDVFGLAGLRADGTLDPSFGSNGLIRTGINAGARINAVTLDAQQRLLAAGQSVVPMSPVNSFTLVRYLGAATGNLAPVAVDDRSTTAVGQSVVIPVLANDLSRDGDTSTVVPGSVVALGDGLHGTAVLNADGTVTYTPPANPPLGFVDTFRYTISDGRGGLSSATITISVVRPPDLTPALSQQPGLIQGVTYRAIGGQDAVGVYRRPVNGVNPGPAGFAHLTTGSTSVAVDGSLSGVDNGVRQPGNRSGAFDAVILEIDIFVPAGDNFLSFDFSFLTNEFPGFLGRTSNDAFVAELDESTWTLDPVTLTVNAPNNFAFDRVQPGRNAISIKSDFFSARRVVTLTDTLYNAGTPQLRAGTPITPGHHKLILSLFDVGDAQLLGQIDSAVFVNNLKTTSVARLDPGQNGDEYRGALQAPVAGEDWVALANQQSVRIPVQANDLLFDGTTPQLTIVTQPTQGTATVVGRDIRYTPNPGFSGEDAFVYQLTDLYGQVSRTTVRVMSQLSRSSTEADAPSDPATNLATNFVNRGTLNNNVAGTQSTVFTLADYTNNPVGRPTNRARFFDVFAPRNGPADRVEIIVNDPSRLGQLMYFNGPEDGSSGSWQPVLSSGMVPPERLPDGRLRIVLDGFSAPRVNFLFGTVFTIPVAAPNTPTPTSTPVASAGGGAGSVTTEFRSDVQLSLGLTSSQATAVRASETSQNIRLNQTGDAASGAGGAGGRASTTGTARSGQTGVEDFDLPLDLVWIMATNPDGYEMLMAEAAAGGTIDAAALSAVQQPYVDFDKYPSSSSTPPLVGPEQEEEQAPPEPGTEPAEVDTFFQIPEEQTPELGREAEVTQEATLPEWAWAALLAGCAHSGERRRREREQEKAEKRREDEKELS